MGDIKLYPWKKVGDEPALQKRHHFLEMNQRFFVSEVCSSPSCFVKCSLFCVAYITTY